MTSERETTDRELEGLQRSLRSLGPAPRDPAFRDRLRREFVTGAIAAAPEPPERTGFRDRLRAWTWILAPAAAAAAGIAALLLLGGPPEWELHDVSATGRIALSPPHGVELEIPAEDPGRLGDLIRPGARIRLPPGGTLDLVAADVLVFQLAEQAVFTVPPSPRRDEVTVALLEAGELRIRTGPGFGGRRLSVRTTDGRADLVGTVVSVAANGDSTCVCVLEGTAFIGEREDTLEAIPAGMRKVMFSNGRPSLVEAIEPHHRAGLVEFVESTRAVFP